MPIEANTPGSKTVIVSPFSGPYANLLKFSFFNASTFLIGLGTPLVLLATELGATSFEVGLIYSFVFLLLPVQIIATAFIPWLGYKKQIMMAWIARGAALVIPFYLALVAPAEPARWMVEALVLSSFLFCLFRTFGSCALPPMLYAILPDEVRGRYFSIDQAITGAAGIFILLLFSFLFRHVATYTAFAWQYAYGLLAVVMTLYYMARIDDPVRPERTSIREIAAETPKICLRRSPFRQYLIFMLASSLMGTAFVPLKAYYLKAEAGLGMDQILLYTAVQYLGSIIGTIVMRNRIDEVGVKPVFRLSLSLSAGVSTYWFFLVTGIYPPLQNGLFVAYFLFGISSSQWLCAHLKYMPRVCDESKQALHVSVNAAAVGIIGGMAPVIWGFLVKLPGNVPGIRDDRFAFYFVALLVCQLTLLLYVPKLTSRHRNRPSFLIESNITRPFRYLGQIINVVPLQGPGRPGSTGKKSTSGAG